MDDKIDSDSFKKELNKNPFLHAGYRGIVRRYNNTLPVPEQENIPFLNTIVFPLILAIYLIGMKLIGIMKRKKIRYKKYNHLISITSTSNYRTYNMTEVGRELRERGENVLFICSPSAEPKLDDWSKIAPTITYKKLHTQLTFRNLYAIFYNSLETIAELRRIISCDEIANQDYILAFNLTLLEYLEYYSLVDLTDENTHFHSMKITSYIISCIPKGQAYIYQHGLMMGGTTHREYPGIKAEETFVLSRNINCYYPLTYFVWGNKFQSRYCQIAHPDSRIVVTGSPWLDHLSSHSEKVNKKDIDVLFISQSYGYTEYDEYEDLVNTVVSACENNNLNLSIKLHPRESDEYYREKGLEQFVGEFKDIDDALRRSRIAITDTSTSFLEASVLDTPIIVTDILDSGLHKWSSTSNILFLNNIDTLGEDILLVLNQSEVKNGRGRLIDVGNSVSDICNVIYSHRDDRY